MSDRAESTICVLARPAARRASRLVSPWMALALGAVISFAAPASAQRADSLRIGARVRVQPLHRPPPQVAGVVAAVDSVNLTLNDSHGSPQIVPLDEILRLERYDGQLGSYEGLRRGARRGFLIGLGTTTVLLVVSLIVPCQGECDMSAPQFAVLLGGTVTAATTVLGGIIGSQYRAVWTRLPIPGCPDIVQCRKRPTVDSERATAAPR